MIDYPKTLYTAIEKHPCKLLFATVSGAHLYGFPSPDSDYDLRGAHILPLTAVVGLDTPQETEEVAEINDEIELDLVTHDIKKFFSLMLRKNGYVLEQLYSPLIVQGGPEHDELKEIGKNCVTRHHSFHYFGFAETQWRLFQKLDPPRVKPLLYLYRVLLTGIHLMRTGVVESNLLVLNEEFRLPYIGELVARKTEGAEKDTLPDVDLEFHRTEYERLRALLQRAHEESRLPDAPSSKPALNDLLKRLRVRTAGDLFGS